MSPTSASTRRRRVNATATPEAPAPRAPDVEAPATDGPVPEGPTATRVLQQFRIVFNAVKSHFQQVERVAGVGGAQVWALSVIGEHPGLGVKELAQTLHVRQPTASILVRNLAGQGLVDVRRDGPDRRAVQLHLLPSGHRVLERAPGPFAGVLPEALAALDPEVLARMEGDLARLITALGADRSAAGVPLAQL